MKISFNLRLRYKEAKDCIKKIQELGGDGNITIGGSWYTGTNNQINRLLMYMGKKNYDLDSMSINENPREATQKRVDKMKKDGII